MLLPNEWIENSIETYIYQHTTKSQVIYWVVLLAVTVTLVHCHLSMWISPYREAAW